jgi:Acetyltransferase (isoleucine patch superfamily)
MSDCSIKAVYDCGGKLASPLVWIEDNVYIGHHTTIVAMEGVHLASGCVLSDYVYLNDSNHGIDPERGLIMQQPVFSKGRIDIGQNCFLGYRAIVLSGVTLGEWCIVGANSVVTNSFPAYSMIAGTPARLIRRYSHGQKAWLKVPARNED